jgi:predicted transcriptional regulator of viral defense system
MYRIKQLLFQEKKLFHTQDLALLWRIQDKNLLYTTIKRYVQRGVLTRIHKGFYCVGPVEAQDSLVLGAVYYHDYCYLSTETVLAREGIINRQPQAITFVGSSSAKFSLGGQDYLFRQMKPERLFQAEGISLIDKVLTANIKRAAADMRYFNPNFHFDRRIK